MTNVYYQTAESVCQGHPDKLCDYLSDCILDAYLEQDPNARVACEVLATTGQIVVAGEVTSKAMVKVVDVVNKGLETVGYEPADYNIQVFLSEQSQDIQEGVDESLEIRSGGIDEKYQLGAGDQGTVYGYATNENQAYLPTALYIAHELCKRADYVRKTGLIKKLKADGKAQVTVRYENGLPNYIDTVVISLQHEEGLDDLIFRQAVTDNIIKPVLDKFKWDEFTKIYINPSGKFVTGGPEADTGLTGRKLMVDTYGGIIPHGGGAFSGKDLTKVDRTGAYMARYIAKNLVREGFADRCLVGLSYAIGKAEPVMVSVETFGTSYFENKVLEDAIRRVFPLTPSSMIEKLSEEPVLFKDTACYGHFSNDDYPWERVGDEFDSLVREVQMHANRK